MPGSCKWCHGPIGASHVGSKWGYEVCKLSHSSVCDGGVLAIPDKRMECPLGYKKGMVMEYENDPRDDSSDSNSEVSGQHMMIYFSSSNI